MLEGPRPEVFAKKKARGREVFALEEQLQLGILHSTGIDMSILLKISAAQTIRDFEQNGNVI